MKTRLITLLVFCAVLLVGYGIYQKVQQNRSEQTQLEQDQEQLNALLDTEASPTDAEPSQEQQNKIEESKVTNTLLEQPDMETDSNKSYAATLRTSEGDIEIALNAKDTPITVNNFVSLARKKFYDTTVFHRTIKGFMIQGGDPKGDGTGGPGYRFDDEPFTGDYTRGTVAMANAGPNTNGSQFFIMHADYALPKNYVIFGRVTKGLDVVDAIATAPVTQSLSGESSKPINPVIVKSIDIVEK